LEKALENKIGKKDKKKKKEKVSASAAVGSSAQSLLPFPAAQSSCAQSAAAAQLWRSRMPPSPFPLLGR